MWGRRDGERGHATSWRREAGALAQAYGTGPRVALALTARGAWCGVGAPPGTPWLSGEAGRGEAARCRPESLPLPTRALGVLVVSFVGRPARAAERQGLLAEAGRVLAEEGTLLVLDHNRPRGLRAALGALAGRPRVPGLMLAARWRRLAHPVAREVQAAGFRVATLRLLAGERIQLVVARRRGAERGG